MASLEVGRWSIFRQLLNLKTTLAVIGSAVSFSTADAMRDGAGCPEVLAAHVSNAWMQPNGQSLGARDVRQQFAAHQSLSDEW